MLQSCGVINYIAKGTVSGNFLLMTNFNAYEQSCKAI